MKWGNEEERVSEGGRLYKGINENKRWWKRRNKYKLFRK